MSQGTSSAASELADSLQPASAQPAALQFRNVADDIGIDFTYRTGSDAKTHSIVESVGGGVGMADYDRDGRLDLLLSGGGRFEPPDLPGAENGLFRQIAGGRFVNVAANAGVDRQPVYSHGVAIADVGSDGFPDLLVTGYGRLTLFLNHGDGTFDQVAADVGLSDSTWSCAAAWGDLSGDGLLDLYVVRYVDWSYDNAPDCHSADGVPDVCSPRHFRGLSDSVYLGQPEATFRDATGEAGLATEGKGLGILLCDFDLDGDLDVYVANDTVANRLYENRGAFPLLEVGMLSGVAMNDMGLPDGSMGVAVGDLTLDGLPDLWVANYERESFALYRNLGGLSFLHASGPMGVTAVGSGYVGWGSVLFDMDRDGDVDVFVANGHALSQPEHAPVMQKCLLFENDAGARLQNVADRAGEFLQAPHNARGVACGDLDGDGKVDLVISQQNDPVAVLRNESADAEHWLALRLIQPDGDRDARGARVLLQSGDQQQVRFVTGGGSYASSLPCEIHFGLGKANVVERLSIHWPDGTTQVEENLVADRSYLLVRGQQPLPVAPREPSIE